MARKPGPGKCVHCLKQFGIRNWDHVFPRSWYPDSTPPNLEKWQIPTCKKCNSDYGKLEEELLVMLAMTVDPGGHASSGIYERALRSVNESLGKGKRARIARRAKREKVLRSFLFGNDIPTEGIYPGLGERWNIPISDQIAFPIPADNIRRFCEKNVRGITYRESGQFVEPPHQVDFFPINAQDAEPLEQMFDRHGRTYNRGPGFEVVRVVPYDEPLAAVFKITLFGEFVMYASISRLED